MRLKSFLALCGAWAVHVAMAGACFGYDPVYENIHESRTEEYRFGILPHYNPQSLFSTYTPLINIINAGLEGYSIRLVASRDYETFDRRLSQRFFHFVFANAYEVSKFADAAGYRIIAKWDDDSRFRGLCVVRRDGAIRSIMDVRHRIIGYPAPSALAATMLPMAYLYQHGIHPNNDVETRYVGSLESSIVSVYLKRVDVGCVGPRPWIKFQHDFPEKAQEMQVLFQTEELPNIAVLARDDVPDNVVSAFVTSLTMMDKTKDGSNALAAIPVSRIVPSDSADFQISRDFLRWFEATLGKMDRP